MPEVQEVKIINIDEVQYNVDSMSETCQRLVKVYNEWNQKEAEARDDLMILQAAKETLSRQIIDQVRKEKAEAEKENSDTEKVESSDTNINSTQIPTNVDNTGE